VDKVSSGVGNILSFFEKKLFVSLINCLKYNDEMAIKNTLEQLVNEKNNLAIAPLYLASKQHPSLRIRKMCEEALYNIEDKENITNLIKDKDVKESVQLLIEKYGNYRYDR